MNFDEFKSKVSKGLQAKNDYQRLTLCYALRYLKKHDQYPTREQTAQYIMSNTTSPLPQAWSKNALTFYKTRIPVWNVLLNKGMIKDFKENGDFIKLTIRPNNEQIDELLKLCNESLK